MAMIALLIGYEAVVRLLSPIPIHFTEAISIAALGLIVNIASAWLLSGSDHHGHSPGQGHAHSAGHSHAHWLMSTILTAALTHLKCYSC